MQQCKCTGRYCQTVHKQQLTASLFLARIPQHGCISTLPRSQESVQLNNTPVDCHNTARAPTCSAYKVAPCATTKDAAITCTSLLLQDTPKCPQATAGPNACFKAITKDARWQPTLDTCCFRMSTHPQVAAHPTLYFRGLHLALKVTAHLAMLTLNRTLRLSGRSRPMLLQIHRLQPDQPCVFHTQTHTHTTAVTTHKSRMLDSQQTRCVSSVHNLHTPPHATGYLMHTTLCSHMPAVTGCKAGSSASSTRATAPTTGRVRTHLTAQYR
jgi:hypothetical protein